MSADTITTPTDQRIREQYTDTQIGTILLWLALRNYDYDAVSVEMNISPEDLRYISRSAEFHRPLDRLLEITIETLLVNIPDRMTAKDWVLAVTSLLDKLIVIRGGVTERKETVSKSQTVSGHLDFAQVLKQADKIMNGEAIMRDIESDE